MYLLITAAVLALVASWGINALIRGLSGDRAVDTRSDFTDLLLRVLGVMELGGLGRLLDGSASWVWVRGLIYLAAFWFLLKMCFGYWTGR